MNAVTISVTALAAVLLSSCSSYRTLTRPPEIEASGLVRGDSSRADDTASAGDIAWKSYFTDPKLQILIAEALDSSADVQIALARVESAEASLGVARAGQGPTVSALAGAGHTRTSSGSDGTSVFGYGSSRLTLGLTASWELDLWGRLSRVSEAKSAALLSSHEYVNLVRTQVVAQVATAYYGLLSLDEQVKSTRQSIDLLTKNVEMMTALKESGRTDAASVSQTEAALCAAQLSLFTLDAQIHGQENAISVLLGRRPGAIDRSSLDAQAFPAGFSTGVPAKALARRPDVRRAELAVEEAYALTGAARASLYPDLAITGGSASSTFLGLTGGVDGFFSLKNLVAGLSASLTDPVFNRAGLKANVKVAEASQKEALLSFRQTVLAAGQEVSDIVYGYGQAVKKDDLRRRQVEALQRAVDATGLLLVAGEVNGLDVLTAEQSLLTAKLNQIDDRYQEMLYAVNLYRALGGGAERTAD